MVDKEILHNKILEEPGRGGPDYVEAFQLTKPIKRSRSSGRSVHRLVRPSFSEGGSATLKIGVGRD